MRNKILFHIGHPAHVHYFKNTIFNINKYHKIYVTSIQKEVTEELLEGYKIAHFNFGKNYRGFFRKTYGLIKYTLKFIRFIKYNKIDLTISAGSAYLAIASWFLGLKNIAFVDTEHARINRLLLYPFATKIITPACFRMNLGKKQIRVDSYLELAYLHPNYFKPNPKILKEIGVKKGERYFFLRFVSWNASHDLGRKGLSIDNKRELVNLLKKKGKIIISSEGKLPEEFEKYKYKIAPEKIHHVLYYANMYIGESGTMATEAAVLGTPTIHIGPLVKYGGVHIDQSKKYGLKFIFTNFDDAFKRVKELLQINPIKLNNEWKIKRGRLIKDKTDIAEFILKLIDKEID